MSLVSRCRLKKNVLYLPVYRKRYIVFTHLIAYMSFLSMTGQDIKRHGYTPGEYEMKRRKLHNQLFLDAGYKNKKGCDEGLSSDHKYMARIIYGKTKFADRLNSIIAEYLYEQEKES